MRIVHGTGDNPPVVMFTSSDVALIALCLRVAADTFEADAEGQRGVNPRIQEQFAKQAHRARALEEEFERAEGWFS